MHEYIARPVYYVGVHLFYASLVWLAARTLTSTVRGTCHHKVLDMGRDLAQFRPAAGRRSRQIPGGAPLVGQASGRDRGRRASHRG